MKLLIYRHTVVYSSLTILFYFIISILLLPVNIGGILKKIQMALYLLAIASLQNSVHSKYPREVYF